MERTTLVAAWMLLICSGCAGPQAQVRPDPSVAAVESKTPARVTGAKREADYEKDLICTVERATGSNIPQRVCRHRAQMDAERLLAEELLRKARVTPCNGVGCLPDQ
jgi:hypothetical protein